MGNSCCSSRVSNQFEKELLHFKDQIYEDIKSSIKEQNENNGTKILFEDDKFRPNQNALGRRITNENPNIKWIRIPKLPHLELANQTPYVYYSEGEKSRKHCKQGRLGNCWFCAVATALSSNVKLYAKIQNIEKQTFEKDEYVGIFHARFYHLGEWTDIVIDDYLPTIDGKLIFAHSKDPNEFWPALLEKAYAKFLGNYDKLWGGDPLDAGIHFSGGFTERYETRNFQSDDEIQELFKCLSEACHKSSIITCSTSYENKNAEILGLRNSHVYTITKLCQFKIRDGVKYNTETIVRIRNPWGEKEWIGAWSDYSDEMKSLKPRHKKRFGIELDNDGEFYMRMSDFVMYFESIQIVALKPREFQNVEVYKSQFKGSWRRGLNAGGMSNHYDSYFSKKFATNPQFLIKNDNKKDCKCVVALSQATLGVKHEDLLSIGLSSYLVDAETEKRFSQKYFEENNDSSPRTSHINDREVMITVIIKPYSSYVIIPSTFKPDQEGQFLLRIVSDKAVATKELLDH